jgi:hypothetical protein
MYLLFATLHACDYGRVIEEFQKNIVSDFSMLLFLTSTTSQLYAADDGHSLIYPYKRFTTHGSVSFFSMSPYLTFFLGQALHSSTFHCWHCHLPCHRHLLPLELCGHGDGAGFGLGYMSLTMLWAKPFNLSSFEARSANQYRMLGPSLGCLTLG